MTGLYGSVLLLLIMLVTGGWASSNSRQQLAQPPVAAAWDVSSPRYLASGASTTASTASTPQTAEALAGCPVTQPPDPAFNPPGRLVGAFDSQFWYGSGDLYISLPLDGTWSQLAHGEKVFWWSGNYPGGQAEPQPAMTIHGRRSDQPGETFEQSGATNASHSSFPATAMLHGLRVPTPGCWEITGEYRGRALSFVVWVP